MNVQAHDSEILCLEFSKPDTGEDPLGFTLTNTCVRTAEAAACRPVLSHELCHRQNVHTLTQKTSRKPTLRHNCVDQEAAAGQNLKG